MLIAQMNHEQLFNFATYLAKGADTQGKSVGLVVNTVTPATESDNPLVVWEVQDEAGFNIGIIFGFFDDQEYFDPCLVVKRDHSPSILIDLRHPAPDINGALDLIINSKVHDLSGENHGS